MIELDELDRGPADGRAAPARRVPPLPAQAAAADADGDALGAHDARCCASCKPDELDVLQLVLNWGTLQGVLDQRDKDDVVVAEHMVALLERGYVLPA